MRMILVFSLLVAAVRGQSYPGRIGVEVADQPTAFVDVGKILRRFQLASNNANAPADSNGWPTSDAYTVLFDYRAVPAWNPPIDDPVAFQPDMSGTYRLSFNGQAAVSASTGSTIQNQTYDVGSNTTTADLSVPAGVPYLVILTFSNTIRTPDAGTNTGITNLRCIRPDYPASQLFTTEFINALAPFNHLRFMGWLDTNYAAGYYGDPGHHIIEWADRGLPSDAWGGVRPGAHGMPWEYVILLANQVNKDIWINIPVSASGADPADPGSYVYQLAVLLRDGLNPNINIYIEHSNEVWNPGFTQYTWNKLAAKDEVASGSSSLNQGTTNVELWAKRRHAKRVFEIGQIFAAVFGPGSMNTRIRPVYAHWTIFPADYDSVLTWMNSNYGAPANYFYGIAQTAYFNDHLAARTASVDDLLAAMRNDSDNGKRYADQIHSVAAKWNVKHLVYEGGPDNGGGSTTNIANRILANRDPRIGDLLRHQISDNWFASGGDLFTYFVLSSTYSRYGSWGATEDYRIPVTAKFNALYSLMDYSFVAAPPAPTGLTAVAGENVQLSWSDSEGATSYSVKRGLAPAGPYTEIARTSDPSFADTTAVRGVTYCYIVTAFQSGIESRASNEVSNGTQSPSGSSRLRYAPKPGL